MKGLFEMRVFGIFAAAALSALIGCDFGNRSGPEDGPSARNDEAIIAEPSDATQPGPGRDSINDKLPTIGVILFDDVLMSEVTAPIDVFSKPREDGTRLFNVVTVAESAGPVTMETGLRVLPDFTFETCPDLAVLIVPSAYEMREIVSNRKVIEFIQAQNAKSGFTVSNCAGSQLIGESGIANGRKIVTYIGGGNELQAKYPGLVVQDDQSVSFVADGKFYSSNGNLASYISSLELLERMSDRGHREFVESYLYLERLASWWSGKNTGQ